MQVLQLNNLIFISTTEGYYMVDTNNKSGKAISEDCYTLISEIAELKNDIKELK